MGIRGSRCAQPYPGSRFPIRIQSLSSSSCFQTSWPYHPVICAFASKGTLSCGPYQLFLPPYLNNSPVFAAVFPILPNRSLRRNRWNIKCSTTIGHLCPRGVNIEVRSHSRCPLSRWWLHRLRTSSTLLQVVNLHFELICKSNTYILIFFATLHVMVYNKVDLVVFVKQCKNS